MAIHQGVIFGSLVLLTGMIWAKISWGVWWVWTDDELVLFLVLFLFYCAYFMLRYSVDAGPARANMCAVYALFGVVADPGVDPRDPAVAHDRHPASRGVHVTRVPHGRVAVADLLRCDSQPWSRSSRPSTPSS